MKNNAEKMQVEKNRDLQRKSDLNALLSAIRSAEERWGFGDVHVEIFSDGSGWVHRGNRPAMEFTTVEHLFELLNK